MAQTVRIEHAAYVALTEIAEAKHLSLTAALSRAVEEYRRATFLEALKNDFAALKADSTAWTDEQAEANAWDATSADGLSEE